MMQYILSPLKKLKTMDTGFAKQIFKITLEAFKPLSSDLILL